MSTDTPTQAITVLMETTMYDTSIETSLAWGTSG